MGGRRDQLNVGTFGIFCSQFLYIGIEKDFLKTLGAIGILNQKRKFRRHESQSLLKFSRNRLPNQENRAIANTKRVSFRIIEK